METPIPIKPVQILTEPKRENLQKQVAQIDEKFEAVKTARNAKVSEIVNRGKSTKVEASGKADPLHTQLKELNEIQKTQRAAHDIALAELNLKQDSYDNIEKRVVDLKSKVKGVTNEEELRNELEDLQYRQQNEKLTNNEERKLVAKIEELKLSLPFVIPLQKLTSDKQEIYKSLKVLKDKQGSCWRAIKQTQTKVKEIRESLDQLKKVKEEANSTGNPEIDAIKLETSELLNNLRK